MSIRILDTNPAASVVIQCPAGMKNRVLAIEAVISGPVDGEQIVVTFSRETNQPLVRACAGILTAATTEVSFFVGGDQSEASLDKIDPVTGVATFVQTADTATGPLPDIWWDKQVTIGLSAISASVSRFRTTIQEESL